MPTATVAPPAAPAVAPPTATPSEVWPEVYRLTAEQYLAMAEAELFGPDDKVELLEGLVVCKMPGGESHGGVIVALTWLLTRLCGNNHALKVQLSLPSGQKSVPEPDLAVVRGGPRSCFTSHGSAAQTDLVVEVSNSSLARDLGVKMRVYADAGIPEYWVVDMNAKAVHVHTLPQSGGYGAVAVVARSGTLPVILRGRLVGSLQISEFLP